MGAFMQLKAADGNQLAAYDSKPASPAKAGILVVQEIFGVNNHIRSVTDRIAQAGYHALAPAFFDRIQKGVDIGYTPEAIAQGREIAMKLKPEQIEADMMAGLAQLRAAGHKKIGITGFCFGGTVAWRGACSGKFDAAVCYYGGGVYAARALKPTCPTMMHFGDKDQYIPVAQVEEIKALHPQVTVHRYDADHGFHCDERGSYDAAAAKIAYARTLEFFAKHLG